MDKELTFHDCCHRILDDPRANAYARGYAQAGLHLHNAEAQRVQALYILSNISHWRHKDSKLIKARLKTIGTRKDCT